MEKEFNLFGGISFSQSNSGENKVREMLVPEFSKPAAYAFLFGMESPEYPEYKNVPAFYIGAQYQIKNLIGFKFTFGQTSYFSYTGAAEPQNFKVTFKTLTMGWDYCIRTTNNRHLLSAGPTFNNYKMSNSNNSYKKNQFNVGLHTGYAFRVFNRKKWYAALTADLNLNPNLTFGPFKYESHDKTVEFEEEEIGMTSFRLGVDFGLRW